MALMKSVVFRGGTDVRSDERAFATYKLNNMPASESQVFIYPRLFALHQLEPEVGLATTVDEAHVVTAGLANIRIPNVVNLSVERLASDGMFLLEDTAALYLWIGRGLNPALLQSLFGLSSLEGMDVSQLVLAEARADDFGRRVVNIVSALREERLPYMQLHIVREGDPMEGRFFWKLVEDRASFNGGKYSYAEFLGHVQRQSHGVSS